MISPKPLMDLSIAYWKSRAFLVAVEIGIFRFLGSEGLPLELLSQHVNIPTSRLKPLVHALVELDCLQIDSLTGDITLTPMSQIFLNPDSPACMEGAFMYAGQMFPHWAQLGQRLKDGAGEQLTPSKASTPAFLQGMHQRASMLTPAVLPLLSFAKNARVLDVAAGAGSWSLAIQQKHEVQLHLLEQTELASAMEEFIGKRGLKNFKTLGGDYHKLDLTETFDVVLYFGALHQEPEERLESVLTRLFSWVAPGGKLYILDIFASGEKDSDLFAWLFGLNMLLTTEGSVFTVQAVQNACEVLPEVEKCSQHRIPVDLPYHLIEVHKLPKA
jgi:SAM-dependent methyltransferase